MKQRNENARCGIGVDLSAQLSVSLRLCDRSREQFQRLIDAAPDKAKHLRIAQRLGP